MTKDELKKALPEMVMFAKNEEEKNHFKKLQSLETPEELDEMVKKHVSNNEVKNDNSTTSKYSKARRT
jgi:hypothetical protein